MVNVETIITVFLAIFSLTYSWWVPLIMRRKIIVYLVVPAFLFLTWVALLVYQAYLIENVFTVVTSEYSRRYLTSFKTGELFQGEKIMGKFVASEDFLGIVGFRFWTFYRLNDDYMIYRIKEQGQDKWYYENSFYKADQFQPDGYFTFGFPPISDSKGKTYVFEIESLQGRPGIAVGVSKIDPVFISKYKYPKEKVLSSSKEFVLFIFLKLLNLFKKVAFTASSFIYLLPTLIYSVNFFPSYKKFMQKIKNRMFKIAIFGYTFLFLLHSETLSIVLIIVGTLLDTFFVKKGDMTVILLLFLWFTAARLFRLKENFFLFGSFCFYALSAIFYYLDKTQISERAGAWALLSLFLVVGLILFPVKKKSLRLYN